MSERHDTHIDDLFKQKLGNYSVPPPPSSWQQISRVLPQPLPFYQRPRFIATLVGLALLVGSGIGYLSYQPIQSLINPIKTELSNQQLSNSNAPSTETHISTTSIANGDLLPNPKTTSSTNILNNTTTIEPANNIPPQDLNNYYSKPLSYQQNQVEQKQANPNGNVKGNINHSKNNIGISYVPSHFLATTHHAKQTSFDINAVLQDANNHIKSFLKDRDNAAYHKNMQISSPTNMQDSSEQVVAQETNEDISKQINNNQSNNTTPTATDQVADKTPSEQANANSSKNEKTAHNTPPAKRPTIRDKKGRILFPRGFTIGTYYSFNNTWIFSPSALEGEQNLHQQITFGEADALSFGYDFNSRFAMSFDWVMRSRQGQVFDYVTHTHIHTKNDVRLTYSHFPLLFKYKFNSYSALTRQPMVLNCMAGLAYGSLKAAEINVPNRNLQNDILLKHSWGFVLGADYDVYLTDNYYVNFGIRANLTTGAHKGELVLPTRSSTNNLLVGAKIGLNYRFVHK